jgi:hypothetical protein
VFPLIFSTITACAAFFKGNGLREAIVKSYIATFLLIAASTEVLSFFDGIGHNAIRLSWITFTILALTSTPFFLVHVNPRTLITQRLGDLSRFGRYEIVFALAVVCVLSITLVLALAYPSNNWDSMTYHMGRVAQWIQNQNVDVYPTANDRQTHNPPLAEWAILHLQLLSTSDRFANIVQWFGFLLSIIVATLIANELGLSQPSQLFSAVIAATLPTAILESSSTQNDLVVTSLCLAFAYFLLKFVRTFSLQDAILCAASLGLALLTKGTAYIYCGAIGLAIGGAALISVDRPRRLTLLGKLAAIVVAALALNAGHLSRTYLVYGLNPTSQTALLNDEMSVTIAYANIVRNGALHIGTPIDRVNDLSFLAVRLLLGDQINNPSSTLRTTEVSVPTFSLHEDYAGNLVHLLLLIFSCLLLPLATVPHKRALYSCAGAILFAVVLHGALLKWQPWATRYHTTIFMLSAPFIASVFVGLRHVQRRLSVGVAIILFASSIPFLFFNKTRPVNGLTNTSLLRGEERQKSYFVNRFELYDDYVAVVKIIKNENVRDVGLCLGYDDYEYPLFVLTGRHADRGTPNFRHVGVMDASKIKENPDLPPPDIILATKRLDDNPIHGKGRLVPDSCLGEDYTMMFDSTTVRMWKLKKP